MFSLLFKAAHQKIKTPSLSFSLTLMHCWTFCTFGIQEQKSQEFSSANPICFHATAGYGNAFSLIKNWCPPVTQSQDIPQYFLSSLTFVINTLGCAQKSAIFFWCDGWFPRRRLPPTELLHRQFVFTTTVSESQQPPLLWELAVSPPSPLSPPPLNAAAATSPLKHTQLLMETERAKSLLPLRRLWEVKLTLSTVSLIYHKRVCFW